MIVWVLVIGTSNPIVVPNIATEQECISLYERYTKEIYNGTRRTYRCFKYEMGK